MECLCWLTKQKIDWLVLVLTVAWGETLTFDNLMKRAYSMVNWCCMCRKSGETIDMLMLICI